LIYDKSFNNLPKSISNLCLIGHFMVK
jgi:hypothetical protein